MDKKEQLTPEQRVAINLQQEKEKYEAHCVESQLFT